MLGQVFCNLIDNSLRHGERVSEIRLSVKKDDPDLFLIYEDNGTGVLPEEKEKIFLKGFGKHTGLGMFLIRGDPVDYRDYRYRENGICLQGARFEIRVPPGKIPEFIVGRSVFQCTAKVRKYCNDRVLRPVFPVRNARQRENYVPKVSAGVKRDRLRIPARFISFPLPPLWRGFFFNLDFALSVYRCTWCARTGPCSYC